MSCRSWQVVQFDPLPVTFIKIVGTHNTANEVSPLLQLKAFTVDYVPTACKEMRSEAEGKPSYTRVYNSLFFPQVFHVVHFECPASTLPSQRQSLV